MYDYTYTCPVCGNEVELMGCPFDDRLVGQCEYCNNKIDMLVDDYKEWLKRKEEEDGS